ncbi:unnamed protein product [Soboliphyme baturini]|uniref:DUF1657 domain-containing protein n=1 Tax=Soboliphyme baturini TaxID=241478 RepID=A0A183J3U8_9BILA|nr:unnamed protein product [Soboliphyme baturini]
MSFRSATSFRLDMLLGSGGSDNLGHLNKLVHEINQMVASYKSLVQLIGTSSDNAHVREDMTALREQCLKTCDTAKNCLLPQLKR